MHTRIILSEEYQYTARLQMSMYVWQLTSSFNMVWHCWNLSKRVFPTALKNTVVYQIKLYPCSFSVYYEKNVIPLHYLVVPA
ncbi:hypothetical protein HanRHA438_Chr17g0797821 [Helianthus annuus]|nr:hypothetical protein HanIR_Chr17g0854801 [Helianthus annuus]KAJ0824942.1 hypothetical protein HanRHA438_Chr17g0797821 [Helianthus annuus]